MLREVQKNAIRQVRKRILTVFILLFLVAGIVFLVFSVFKIKTIEVEGCKQYTKEQLVDKLVVDKLDTNSLYFYLKYQFFEDINIPFIEKIDIELTGPQSIKINVYEKVITGCVSHMGNILYFDKDGIIVESSKKKLPYIPYIVGLKYDKLVLNEKLEIQKEELFNVILGITKEIKKFKLDVEKVVFDQNSNVTLIWKDVKILLGKQDGYHEQIANLKNILPEIEGLSGELDMRNIKDGKNKFVFKKSK